VCWHADLSLLSHFYASFSLPAGGLLFSTADSINKSTLLPQALLLTDWKKTA
jgi:hypothetical protein